MSTLAAEVIAIFWALDDGRQQQLTDEARRLVAAQEAEDMGKGTAAGKAAGAGAAV
jgi:hypothetical protein